MTISSLHASQLAVAAMLPPGAHFIKNGGLTCYTVTRVDHALIDDRWATTVVAKLHANRHLTDGGADHYFRPVRFIDGWLSIVGDGWIDVITAEQAAEFEERLKQSYQDYLAEVR